MFKQRIKTIGFLCILTLGYLLYSLSGNASEVVNSQTSSVSIQNTVTGSVIIGSNQDSDLTELEWKAYQKLMQGPAGRWYPQLSPATVLGLNAKNDQERQHFAEIVAKEEHDKIVNELKFNHAFYVAMRQLYPTEPIIQTFDKTPFNPGNAKGIHHE